MQHALLLQYNLAHAFNFKDPVIHPRCIAHLKEQFSIEPCHSRQRELSCLLSFGTQTSFSKQKQTQRISVEGGLLKEKIKAIGW